MALSGGIGQIAGSHYQIGNWAHLEGMISGMIIAGLFLKLTLHHLYLPLNRIPL